jgi:hypothetical protein
MQRIDRQSLTPGGAVVGRTGGGSGDIGSQMMFRDRGEGRGEGGEGRGVKIAGKAQRPDSDKQYL